MRFSRADLADLSYFLVVARHRSLRRASLELGISASAVSHALKALEARLAVRLLNRTSRSVTLTVAGEELRQALDGPFEAIAAGMQVLDRFRDGPSGHVRLNLSSGAAGALLSPVLPVFVERYPDIQVELSVTNRLVDVVGEGFDAGIRFGGTVPEDMIAQRLSPDTRWVVAGAPSYLETNGVPAQPHDLAGHQWMKLRLGDQSLYRWEFERGGDCVSVDVPGPIILDDGALAMQLALQGVGLVYMNEWDVRDHVAAGRLATVLDDWSPPGEGYFMYYSGRRQVPNGVRHLIELIRELRPLG